MSAWFSSESQGNHPINARQKPDSQRIESCYKFPELASLVANSFRSFIIGRIRYRTTSPIPNENPRTITASVSLGNRSLCQTLWQIFRLHQQLHVLNPSHNLIPETAKWRLHNLVSFFKTSSTTGLVRIPTPSISTVTSSPATKYLLGSLASPTPEGSL